MLLALEREKTISNGSLLLQLIDPEITCVKFDHTQTFDKTRNATL